jgi:hypothetical protein
MVRRSTHKHKRRSRKQRGGDGYGYASTAFTASAGIPIESRTSYSHCDSGMRVAPATGSPTLWGGRRRTRRQRGGACCGMVQAPAMNGGGAGTGGYSLAFDNSLGKTYSEVVKAPCPSQAGGSGSIYEQVAFPASYGYDTGSAFLSSSAHFLEPKADVSRCASGGRRKTRRSRKHKKHGSKAK